MRGEEGRARRPGLARARGEQAREVVDVDEGAAVLDRGEGKRHRGVGEPQQREQVAFGSRAVDERAAHDDANSRARKSAKRLLRIPLRARVRPLRIGRVARGERTRARLLAVHLDRAEEDETPRAGARRGFGERAGLLDIIEGERFRVSRPLAMHARGEMEDRWRRAKSAVRPGRAPVGLAEMQRRDGALDERAASARPTKPGRSGDDRPFEVACSQEKRASLSRCPSSCCPCRLRRCLRARRGDVTVTLSADAPSVIVTVRDAGNGPPAVSRSSAARVMVIVCPRRSRVMLRSCSTLPSTPRTADRRSPSSGAVPHVSVTELGGDRDGGQRRRRRRARRSWSRSPSYALAHRVGHDDWSPW